MPQTQPDCLDIEVPQPVDPDLVQAAEKYDKYLLDLIDRGCKRVLTKEGEVVEVDLTAADLQAIRSRLKDVGLTRLPQATRSSGASALADIDQSDGIAGTIKPELPPVNQEEEQ